MSVAVSAPLPVAGVPGTLTRFWKLAPPSVVRRTVPSASSRKPLSAEEKENARIVVEQRRSLEVNGRRRKVWPPSSERRTVQPPPITTESASIDWTRSRFAKVPVESPVQVAPASSVVRSVPKSPTAKPRAPAKARPRRVLPCGLGLPHCQPEWPTETGAALAAGLAASRRRAAARTPRRRDRIMASSTASGNGGCGLSLPAGGAAQRVDLRDREPAACAHGQLAERERPEGHAAELPDGVPDGLAHSLDLPL